MFLVVFKQTFSGYFFKPINTRHALELVTYLAYGAGILKDCIKNQGCLTEYLVDSTYQKTC